MELITLLKQHLLNHPGKIYASFETHQWYKNDKPLSTPQSTPVPPPQIPIARTPPPPPLVKKTALEPVMKGFKLNPKKEAQDLTSKSLLDKLKTSVEGVDFYDKPPIPTQKKALLVCTEEEKALHGEMLEKLAGAINQKIMPCTMTTTPIEDHTIISTADFPPLNELSNDPSLKAKLWKELKECLSKSS